MSTSSGRTRRQVLTAAGVVASVGSTGCLGLGWFDASDPSAITDITTQKNAMILSLNPDVDLTNVNYIAPDGTQITQQPVAGGQTTVKFPLGTGGKYNFKPFTPGTYKIVAEHNGETQQTKTIELTKSLNVVTIGTTTRNTSTKTAYAPNLTIEVKNTGSLPIRLTSFSVTNNVPNPVTASSPYSLERQQSNQTVAALKETVMQGQTAHFTTTGDLLVNRGSQQFTCNGRTRPSKLVLGGTRGFQKTQPFTLTYGGEAVSANSLVDEVACSNVTISTSKDKQTSS